MAEWGDAQDLGSCDFGRAGSMPVARTKIDGRVMQLEDILDSKSRSCGFEAHRAYQVSMALVAELVYAADLKSV